MNDLYTAVCHFSPCIFPLSSPLSSRHSSSWLEGAEKMASFHSLGLSITSKTWVVGIVLPGRRR